MFKAVQIWFADIWKIGPCSLAAFARFNIHGLLCGLACFFLCMTRSTQNPIRYSLPWNDTVDIDVHLTTSPGYRVVYMPTNGQS